MARADEKLFDMKKRVDDIQAPQDLEDRLNRALEKKIRRTRQPFAWQARVAALLIFFMLFGYHFPTLAYYGRRFVGYDRIIDGSLQKLNALGRGQTVERAYEFADGKQFFLDGIMLDGNQLLAFCRITSPDGDLENFHALPNLRGTVGRYPMRSGAGVLSDDGTELHYVFHFDPPQPWERTLIISFVQPGAAGAETGEIRFRLDRQKAMGFLLRVVVQQSFTVEEGQIRILSLDASPTRTRIRGRIQGILGLAVDTLRGERFRPERMEIQLLVNGEVWPLQGGGMTTGTGGITFENDYEALPAEILSLQLRLVSFKTDRDVAVTIPLALGQEPVETEFPGGHGIQIESVWQNGGGTYVTLTTDDALRLSRVHLKADGTTVSLQETQDERLIKTEDGRLLRTRTLHFAGTGAVLSLAIQRIAVDVEYDQILSIPLE